MTLNTKVDLINGAYSQLRISGLTTLPAPEDLELAINRLESMAAEFEGRNICTGYFFEDNPDPNTPHNVERKYWQGYETNLACRLLADFGKEIPAALLLQQQQSYSFLSSSTAMVKRTQYPTRQPRGSGNTLKYNRWQRFNYPVAEAPIGCATNKMFVGDVNDFVEHYESYLRDGEDIASFVMTSDAGLTVNSSSINTGLTDIDYQILADGDTETSSNSFLQVKIVMTTTDSRIETRFIDFALEESDL